MAGRGNQRQGSGRSWIGHLKPRHVRRVDGIANPINLIDAADDAPGLCATLDELLGPGRTTC